jgi:hypothetical protein
VLKEDRLKDTILDDNAAIYNNRDSKSEKQKLKEMSFSEKISYLKTYYLTKTIVIIAIIGFVGYLGYSILSPKAENVLYTAIINYALTETEAAKLEEDFTNLLELDPEKETVLFDASFYLGLNGDVSEYTLSSEQKLTTYLFAGEIDVLIAPEADFKKYAGFGYLSKLTDELPTDLCTQLADSFFYSTTEDNPASGAYGIYLEGAKLYDSNGKAIENPVIGIVVNSENKQNAVELIRYLYQMY